jgi:glycosyltransferase involved in cell wall biosynthesis
LKKISVCIATYNGEKYILEQLHSIIKQLNDDDEVIISDDSSTDRTLEVIESLADHRIKIFPNQMFKSAIFNFENAIKHASNDLIFLSDQDDLWVDSRVDVMRNSLLSYDMVVCDHSLINDKGDILSRSYFKEVPSGPGIFKNLKKNTYYGCCMAFHRKVLKKAIPFPKDIPMHDIWLGFVGDLFYKTHFVDFPYTLYRKHDNNVSNASEVISNNDILTKFKFRWNVLKYFPMLLAR